MTQSLAILESFTFTLESIKHAEAERNYQLNKTGRCCVTESGTGARDDTTDNVKSSKTTVYNANVPAKAAKNVAPTTTASASKQPTKTNVATPVAPTTSTTQSLTLSLADQIAKARQILEETIKSTNSSGGVKVDPDEEAMRVENELLKKKIELLESQVKQLTDRVAKLEVGGVAKTVPTPASKPSGDSKKDDDDDVDLFGSDEEEDAEAAKLKEARLAEYAAKKSKKPALVAKSNVILDVKPWDDETDMKELEKQVRSIEMDGLLWGTSKLVEIAFGVKKLQIATVVEDDKVSIEELQEKIEAFEDFVQSVDIAAFNKI